VAPVASDQAGAMKDALKRGASRERSTSSNASINFFSLAA
jgi:hypothetical protein